MNAPVIGHDLDITIADQLGVPLRAECSCSGWSWRRPDDDRWAESLSTAHADHVEVAP